MPSTPVKKKRPKIAKRRRARSESILKKRKKVEFHAADWVAIGIDISVSSIAGAAFGYDSVLKKEVGPAYTIIRWERGDDYFIRMKQASMAHKVTLDLIGGLRMMPEIESVYVALEEPWPFGMQKKLESNSLKQQAQISGAFMGGLLRWGYAHVFEIHNQWWKQIVARDLGITTHWSKYGKGVDGKMRSKEWALKFHDAPDWPDLIQHSKRGLIPRPDESKAKAQQPDDRYDALAISMWMRNEIAKGQNEKP